MKRRVSLLTSALLALTLMLLVRPASAHANLIRSTPAAGAVLETAPPTVELEFSEELDPAFSRVQLFSSQNQLIEPGPGEIAAASPNVVRLIIPDLAKDSYTVIWRVRSAADGHITEGSIPFGVGVAPRAGSLIPAPGAPDPATLPPPPLDTIARWLNYIAAAIALGGFPFALLVWRPAYRKMTKDERPKTNDTSEITQESLDPSSFVLRPSSAADETMTRFLRRMAMLGGIAFLLSNLFFLLTQAATAAEVSLTEAIGAPLLTMLSGRTGLIWLARFALIVQIIVLSRRLPPAGGGPARLWWVSFVIGDVMLLTLSLLSHAAASTQAPIAIPLDWLHLTAMVAWVGGLIPLAAAIAAVRRDGARALPLALIIPRFTRLALPCVIILTLTGLYTYFLHINGLDLLTATTYGRALLIKLGLFVVLIALGIVNMQILERRLRSAGNQLARAFGRTVRTEIAVGALVLLTAGVLTSVAPSLAAWQAHEQQGIAQSATLGDVDMTLRIAPAQIGDNEFAVDVTDRRPGAASAPTKVLLRFDMQGMAMGKLQTEAAPSGGERYTTRGSFTSMGGRWDIEVVLRRAGFDDITHVFQVDILRGAPFVIEQ
jgi:copper transport protein